MTPSAILPTAGEGYDFTAPASGVYTITISSSDVGLSDWLYSMELRPIELFGRTVDPAASTSNAGLVSYTGGGLYAWLNASQTDLTFSGPTGIGFQVGGHWRETTVANGLNGGYTSTYKDTGDISLTMLGQTLTIPLPSGASFTVTTQADGADGLFGQETGESLNLGPVSLADLVDPMQGLGDLSSFNFLGGDVSSPGVRVGIDLGSSSGVQSTNLPVDPAVPYLYFSLSTDTTLTYGNISVRRPPRAPRTASAWRSIRPIPRSASTSRGSRTSARSPSRSLRTR